MLEIVGGALKDVSTKARDDHREKIEHEKNHVLNQAETERQRELIIQGGGHDPRMDCIAGNGIMSELGFGDEPTYENDLSPLPPPLMDDTAPIHGEAVPPTAASLAKIPVDAEKQTPLPAKPSLLDLDEESEQIRSLPIVVLKNFAQKSARGDLWNVLSEWGAGLLENQVAHVIVVTEGATATKALTKALPSKPLNTVSLADADEVNSLAYVRNKLAGHSEQYKNDLSTDDQAQVAKIGGRMVDLETIVYKVRTGSTIPEAVEDIITRNVVELRKLAFGDDTEDAKSLPWSRAQAWKLVSSLAKTGEVSLVALGEKYPLNESGPVCGASAGLPLQRPGEQLESARRARVDLYIVRRGQGVQSKAWQAGIPICL